MSFVHFLVENYFLNLLSIVRLSSWNDAGSLSANDRLSNVSLSESIASLPFWTYLLGLYATL